MIKKEHSKMKNMVQISLIRLVLSILLIFLFACVGFGSLNSVKKELYESNEEILFLKSQLELKNTWFAEKNYSLFTKSQLLSEKENLQALILELDKWGNNFSNIIAQAVEEINAIDIIIKNNSYLYPYSDEDLYLLAYIIEYEAGANIVKDEEQKLVACVILNRKEQGGINKSINNATIKDIINEPGQYSICKYDGSIGKNTHYVDLTSVNVSRLSDRSIKNAMAVLEREYTCPKDVLFQGLINRGRVYKSFWHEAPFNNTTYFCYG